jgi:hypothetical protein
VICQFFFILKKDCRLKIVEPRKNEKQHLIKPSSFSIDVIVPEPKIIYKNEDSDIPIKKKRHIFLFFINKIINENKRYV